MSRRVKVDVNSRVSSPVPASVAIADWVAAALDAGHVHAGRDLDLAVAVVDAAAIRDLNRRYRHRDRPTNVLSFAQLDEVGQRADFIRPPGLPVPLGDVIIAHTTVVREAARDARDFSDHLCHLVVHGVLHLVGFDHIYDDEAGLMESLEGEVLAEMGIRNPYAVASDQHFSDQQ